jgi:hypothetical protein
MDYLFWGMHPLLAVSAVFKLWMVVDLIQRGAPGYWFWVILWLPFGEWAYFLVVKRPDLFAGLERRRRARPLPVDTLRYQYRENPCAENAVALADRLLAEAPEEAAALYDEVLARDPAYLRALHGLGRARLALGDAAAAEDAFRRVLERESGYSDRRVWLDLAEALQRGGRPGAAVELLQELVRTDPRLHHCIALASALAAAGRAAEAGASLEAALEHHRHAPRHLRRFARRDARRAAKLLASLRDAPTARTAGEPAAG